MPNRTQCLFPLTCCRSISYIPPIPFPNSVAGFELLKPGFVVACRQSELAHPETVGGGESRNYI